MTYYAGDVVRLIATFTSLSNVLTDPSSVSLLVMAPDWSEQTYISPDVVRDSIGVYHYDLNLTMTGVPLNPGYRYRWTGTGAVAVVGEGSVAVAQTNLRVGAAFKGC